MARYIYEVEDGTRFPHVIHTRHTIFKVVRVEVEGRETTVTSYIPDGRIRFVDGYELGGGYHSPTGYVPVSTKERWKYAYQVEGQFFGAVETAQPWLGRYLGWTPEEVEEYFATLPLLNGTLAKIP